MRFEQQAILGHSAFAETGQPSGIYWDRQATRLAIASRFDALHWHGRNQQTSQALMYRVTIYNAQTVQLLATLDGLAYPVNDVAFHPHQSLLAVATGAYDGGHFYQGALLLWDLETGQALSLLDEDREVTQCSFDEEGHMLHVTLRPQDDMDESPGDLFLHATLPMNVWHSAPPGGVVVRHVPFTPSDPSTPVGSRMQDERDIHATMNHVARRAGAQYEARWFARDVAWTAEGDVVAVRNNTALERWTLQGERVLHVPDPWDGVQLLVGSTGAAFINLSKLVYTNRWMPSARTEQINMESGQRVHLSDISVPVLLSMASSGALLSRDGDVEQSYTGTRRPGSMRQDRLLTPEPAPPWSVYTVIKDAGLVMSEPLDLGAYDALNHYFRVDGARHLYFVQGTPPTSRHSRWICRIDPLSLRVERLFPLIWDSASEDDITASNALHVSDELGTALIVSYQSAHKRGQRAEAVAIVRRHLPEGSVQWATQCTASVTAIALIRERKVIVFALSDGHIGILSAATGQIQLLQPVQINGARSIYLALAAKESRIAAGTIDGRIVVSKLIE